MSIRLAMLARDEADRMAGVAEACGGLVDDYVVLVDSRTTDDTESAVREALGDRGVVRRFKFRDFADARNQLFAHSRPGADYLLLVDPDSPPRGSIPDDLDPSVPLWDCEWRSAGFKWRLPILVRADLDCGYVGAVHELLVGPVAAVPLDTLSVEVLPKPLNVERLSWMAEVLKKDAAHDPRAAFYYAQSLRDLGRRGEAFDAYLRRAGMGWGWAEEVWCSVYEAAALVAAVDEELAATLWQRCIALNPGRAEPYWQLARAAGSRGRFTEQLAWASSGLRVEPGGATLFVNTWMATDGMREQFQMALAGLGLSEGAMVQTVGDAAGKEA